MLARTDKEPVFFMAYKKEKSPSRRLLYFFIFRIFSVKFLEVLVASPTEDRRTEFSTSYFTKCFNFAFWLISLDCNQFFLNVL